ncbi:hypothetical protein FJY71_00425 [candidate division WOR-3 bacterium]|nr:hypothetical protein [candidate division WOR-3 bacterium]
MEETHTSSAERESKADRFRRVAQRRVENIVEALRILGNCSNRSTYEYTGEQVEQMFDFLLKQCDGVKRKFGVAKMELPKFRF